MPAGPAEAIASYLVVFTAAPAGNTFFLPFNNNEIHSIRLSANPGPADVRYVFTVNLSGCAVFVDEDPGGNWIYFHHANCIGPPFDLLNPQAQPPSAQEPMAVARLNQLHTQAMLHMGWIGNPRPTLFKSAYYANLDPEWVRKRGFGQWRSNVEAWAGTTAWGFYNGAAWEFWYQTFGAMTYDRPWISPTRYRVGKRVTLHNKAPDTVLGVARFA